jgi:cell wall-associated NlpC family hydrolase
MRTRLILTSIIVSAAAFLTSAQTPQKNHSAHAKAHQEQLAGRNKMDNTVISSMINKEVENRENASELSKESAGMIEDLLSEAKRYIGRPYVHGAKGPNAFDCSGFTSYIYKQFGYSISPSSRAQYTYGESVDRKSLRKGDLVFFTSRNSGKNVGHVGIVYSVDNETGSFKFIHASISGVKISDFAGYYVSRYIGAKRLIQK